MKKNVLLLFCALVLPAGCSYILPQSNESPNAYIDVIAPSEVAQGQAVTFAGHGTDADGQVVGYRWRSDRDGELGTTAEFETSSLSVGSHVISLAVQDNNDAWSSEVQGSVTVTATVSMPARIDSFTASSLTISPGESVTLSWSVANATTVSIDQGIGTVSPAGSDVVAPAVTTTYRLTAAGTGSVATAGLTVTVRQAAEEVTLTADVDASGFLRSSGAFTTGFVYVGDDSYNRGFQGFLTFDISCIPDEAVISRVTVDLSDYEVPYDDPCPEFGCLRAYVHDYGSIDSGDYWSHGLSGAIGEWCDSDDLETPTEQVGFLDALQQIVGTGRFQCHLMFTDTETDGDDKNDLLRWPIEHLPTITVEYLSD